MVYNFIDCAFLRAMVNSLHITINSNLEFSFVMKYIIILYINYTITNVQLYLFRDVNEMKF